MCSAFFVVVVVILYVDCFGRTMLCVQNIIFRLICIM